MLKERDPDAAALILPENGRRIVRALEVVELTGGPFSASLPVLEYADPHTVQIGVDIDRETLDERIAARVDAMFTGGFVDEVRRLLDHGLAEGRTAPRAIGYREVVAHLRGELTEQEARDQTAQATRRFARRQDSWFRKDPRIVWIRYDDPQLLDKALAAVASGSEQDRSGARRRVAARLGRMSEEHAAAATGCASCWTRCSTRTTTPSTTWPATPTPRRTTSTGSSPAAPASRRWR